MKMTNLEREYLAETIINDFGKKIWSYDHNCNLYDDFERCTQIESSYGIIEVFNSGEIYVNDRLFKNIDELYDVYIHKIED